MTTAKLLGAAEDLLAQLDGAASAYRYRQRLLADATLRAILPAFTKDMIRADMARRLATDNSPGASAFAVTDAQIESWFDVRHIAVTWTIDGIPAQGSGNTYPLQGFATQSSSARSLDWPTSVVWWLFAEGTFVFLDGGRLDLGIVRDNVSNNTNDFGIFQETFEGVAFRGLESLKVISAVRPNGETAGTVSTASY